MSNVQEPSERTTAKSIEVLKQISSTGYLRKRVPQELMVLQGGGAAGGATSLDASDPVGALNTLVPETATQTTTTVVSETAISTGTATSIDARTKAKMQGYEGDPPCGECGNYTLVRNGTCMKCNTCGSTTGCS